ncbi:hypothetical protein ACJ41O_012324 [Fusarium nematophilum]
MTILRQSFARLPPASALRVQHALFSVTSQPADGKARNPVSADPNHDYKTKKPTSDLADGAQASLKAASGKQDATSFQNQNLTDRERKTNSQNAQEPDSKEGYEGESSKFEKSGRSPKPFRK